MFTPAVDSFNGKKILILGEAPGEEEIKAGSPFVGPSGKLLRETLLPEAGFDPRQFWIANVFNTKPPRNDIKAFTETKTEFRKRKWPLTEPAFQRRRFLPERHAEAMATLAWIKKQDFDFIICLGGTALWLLLGDGRIGTFRGTIAESAFGVPYLATYHPAAVLREFKMRPLAWADLVKVRRHLEGTLTPPLARTFIYSPTEQELWEALAEFKRRPTEMLGVDIETAPVIDQITTISFATPDYAICIPIWDKYAGPANHNVAPSAAAEVAIWRWIERFCKLPNPKVLQNGLYDIQYLLDAAPLQLRLTNVTDDTNILSHALQPELPKDLGTLASLYLNEPGWKQMRGRHDPEEKGDE